ncbi:unnamed protein product [Dibothriocephalus latus]|uniref:Uncharacterized protein n=1 Tax=Dibothriocephalus latus TaxID=60516 RepID=A0A3P7MQZ0_DIBLA|nr:unnamed protein product [Dibothriocephalus latus]
MSGSGSANFAAITDESAGDLENANQNQSILKRASHLLSSTFNCIGRRGKPENGQEPASKNEERTAVENVPLTMVSSSVESYDGVCLNDSEMARKVGDSMLPFGTEPCNNMIESLTYLARFCKLAFSAVTLSVLEQPVGNTSATFQILLHKVRKQTVE